MLPLSCWILVVDHLGFLPEVGVGLPLLGNVHEFVNDLLVLLVEQFHMFLRVKMHGVVSKAMHLSDGVFVKHTLRALFSDFLKSHQMAFVFQLPFDLVKRFCLA